MLTWAAQRTLWKVRDRGDLAAFGDAAGPADVRQDQVDGLLAQPLLELPGALGLAGRDGHLQRRRARRILDVLGRERVFEPADAQALKLRPTARAVWLA